MRLSTKELFEIYYSNVSSVKEKKTRGQIDRDELYNYEKELGKSLLDFDPEECFQLLVRFQNENKYSISYEFSYQSFMMHQCALKDFFNWYIENYEVIRNPFLNSFFTKYDVIQEKLSRSRTVFTTKKMEEIIEFFIETMMEFVQRI